MHYYADIELSVQLLELLIKSFQRICGKEATGCSESLSRAKNLFPRLSFRVVIILSRQRQHSYNHYHNLI